MKKSLILLSGIISLNGAVVNQQNINFNELQLSKFNSSKQINKYEVGMSFYKNKNYKVSYEIFNALVKNNIEDKQINFYLGRSAFKLGLYDESYSAYERILIKYPNETRAKLEIARIYFIQSKYQNSKKLFLEVKKENLPKEVENKVDHYLSKINNKLQKNNINALYMFGIGYDTNINNRANNDKFNMPNSSLVLTNSTKDESSVDIFAAMFINHKYQYNDTFTFANNFLIYAKKLLKDSTKDIAYISYLPSIITHNDEYSIEYGLFVDFLRYENNYYLQTYGINPKIYYTFSSQTQINVSLKYQNKDNQVKSNKVKDAKYINFNINAINILNDKYTLHSKFELENEKKDSGNLTNIDYSSINCNLLLNYKYSNKLSISPSIYYKNKKYKDTHSIYLKKQVNKEYTYSLDSLYLLDNAWVNKVNITHNNVKSNIDSSSYKKNTLSISFMKRF